jgi:hypothetical protein
LPETLEKANGLSTTDQLRFALVKLEVSIFEKLKIVLEVAGQKGQVLLECTDLHISPVQMFTQLPDLDNDIHCLLELAVPAALRAHLIRGSVVHLPLIFLSRHQKKTWIVLLRRR